MNTKPNVSLRVIGDKDGELTTSDNHGPQLRRLATDVKFSSRGATIAVPQRRRRSEKVARGECKRSAARCRWISSKHAQPGTGDRPRERTCCRPVGPRIIYELIQRQRAALRLHSPLATFSPRLRRSSRFLDRAFGGASCNGQGVDYETKTGTFSFAPGSTQTNVLVKVCGDSNAEANETFRVVLSNISGATLLPSAQGLGTIVFVLPAQDVRPIPGTESTEVIIRLPDIIAPGTCTFNIRAHACTTNIGTFRIAP